MLDLTKIIGFEWDGGDRRKTDKHGVAMALAEKIFFNAPLRLPADGKRSRREPRTMPWVRRMKDGCRTLPSRCASLPPRFV